MISNGRDSSQLFVGVFDTFLARYLLLLPSGTQPFSGLYGAMAILATTEVNSSHCDMRLELQV